MQWMPVPIFINDDGASLMTAEYLSQLMSLKALDYSVLCTMLQMYGICDKEKFCRYVIRA